MTPNDDDHARRVGCATSARTRQAARPAMRGARRTKRSPQITWPPPRGALLYLAATTTTTTLAVLVILSAHQPRTDAAPTESHHHQQVMLDGGARLNGATQRRQESAMESEKQATSERNNNYYQQQHLNSSTSSAPATGRRFRRAPNADTDDEGAPGEAARLMALEGSISAQCRRDSDCDDTMRCYQGKCICPKDRPIEDRGVCLPSSVVGEACSISEQCLGNSVCLEGYCSCGSDSISLFNPSSKIFYCHPKRRLREECGHDAQCPSNSFCSTNKCLCQNGFGPSTVRSPDGAESAECLAKKCARRRDCESEYHVCEDNRCMCLADHFDPHTAECYKFGSTGGNKLANQTGAHDKTRSDRNNAKNKSFTSILKDLISAGDSDWYAAAIILILLLTILLLALIVMTCRRYFLGYCWTAHKKEYEPNNGGAPRGGYFNKDSINNKSFRQRTGEMIDDDGRRAGADDDYNDDTAADRSNLVTTTGATTTTTTVNKSRGGGGRAANNNNNNDGSCSGSGSGNQRPANGHGGVNKSGENKKNRYAKVDMRGANEEKDDDDDDQYEEADSTNAHYQPYQQAPSRPLSTSNSTAV